MIKHTLLLSLAFMLGAWESPTLAAQDKPITLAGQWRFQLDRADAGVRDGWFTRPLTGRITLPGGLTEQGIGDPVGVETKWIGDIVDKSWFTAPEFAPYRQPGNVKIPFWLQPELYYAGAAWFQRDIEIPQAWAGRRVVLFLERAHWVTSAWLDGRAFGTNSALATPHEYDLGLVQPGRHTLTLCVDNRLVIDVGQNSHSVSDHTQGNWNGIVGRIELHSTPAVWMDDLQAHPNLAARSVAVRGTLRQSAPGAPPAGNGERVELVAKPLWHGGVAHRATATVGADGRFEATIPLGPEARTWDEFNPALYELTATVPSNHASLTTRFGLREITTEGTQFLINGRKLFFRGTLECCIFPKTGHPPTDVAEWKRIIGVARGHGLNMLRFHSWCPPEAAFVAADELGFYFHVECSSWANQSTTIGDGKPVDAWMYEETARILKAYGSHPSFVLLLHGNEPGGRNHQRYLAVWVEHFKNLDARHLISAGAGWPQLPENQFHVTPDPRVQGWGEGNKSRINGKAAETTTDYREYIRKRTVPVISHEIGQWCVYPNFDEIRKYTGYLKPRNFEIFRDRLESNGMARLARPFLISSGKLQALCYKEDIEAALRTPGMGGFQLLDLHDFPGQGTALVGVLDPFWGGKGYISPAEFRRFCNTTVPLARLPRRVFTTSDRLTAGIEIAHFGPEPLVNAVVEWKLVSGGKTTVARGAFPPQTIPVDNAIPVGEVGVNLNTLKAPSQCRLVVRIRGTDFENDWDLWVYPAGPATPPAAEVLVTSRFDAAAEAHLRAGHNLLLTIPGNQVRKFDTAPVKLGFSSIFWNTAWTGRQPPTTLGILCDPKHPALSQFPTDSHSNWQWWHIIHEAGALRLDLLPKGTDPVVRIIDDWVTARPLGLVVEGRVGAGRIIICGFDLTRDAGDPVLRQMRESLVRHLTSKPSGSVPEFTPGQIQSLIREQSGMSGVREVKAASQPGYEAVNAMDGDPSTLWHTPYGDSAPGFPHDFVVEFEAARRVSGITALPRQDGNPNGWIKGYEISVSQDGRTWGKPLANGEFDADKSLKTVEFEAPVSARFLRLRALSGHTAGEWASLAELNILAPSK